MPQDEKKWLRLAQKGDAHAFARLVDLHARPVYNLCFRMLGSSQDAEDAAQETFLRAFRSFGRYDPERKFLIWLLSIAANHCIDRYRRSKEKMLSLEDAPIGTLRDAQAGPEALALRGETRDELQVLLISLDPRDRAAIVLHYWHDFSYEEIAMQLSMTESALKSRLHRARQVLASGWQQAQAQPVRAERRTYERATF